MPNYHLVVAEGVERNVVADAVKVDDTGALVFLSGGTRNHEVVVAYAAGCWMYVEVERKDD